MGTKLTASQKHDRRDTTPAELRLIRVGHALWAILRRDRRKNGVHVSEEQALYDAIEIIVRLKRELRDELAAERTERSKLVRERFALIRNP